ncbi:hypothetical protein ACFLU6_01395 [Acidobacteriota bacterium]
MKESRIGKLIEKHESIRSQGINLIASENVLSEAARKALASDLAGRYHSTWYSGVGTIQEIIKVTEELARQIFGAKHAIVMAQSGNLCDLAVLFAFTEPGDRLAMLPFEGGGYPLGTEKFHRNRLFLPIQEGCFDIDLDKAEALLKRNPVPLLLVGASFNVFPQPVKELKRVMRNIEPPGVFAYDGSHVLGLIACGQFQDPLKEGADVLVGSTHKSLFGPQGGLILTNSDELAQKLDRYLGFDIDGGLGLLDNPHVNRIAALGITLEEIIDDPGYGMRVIENARALASALDGHGVPVRFKERGYTQSHQVFMDLTMERSEELCGHLEKVGIFIDIGARIGVAEMTRRGMGPARMADIAALIAEVYTSGPKENLKAKVRELAGSVESRG